MDLRSLRQSSACPWKIAGAYASDWARSPAIEPSEENGNEQRIYIAPMKNPWTLAGDRVLLSAPTYDWERETRNINQGPVALQHNGKTFIVYSASYCGGVGYKLGMLTYTGGDPLQTSS